MRVGTTSLIVAAAFATTAVAQLSPLALANSLVSLLTPSCQSTVKQLVASNSSIAQCVHTEAILPILQANGSILPPLDDYLDVVCSSAPCSNTTLAETYTSILEGCSSDLASLGITNDTVAEILGLYPLAREVVCLKTTDPYSAANATIPITADNYNTTNGSYCATSLLTSVSTYLGANLTNNYVDTLLIGANGEAYRQLLSIPQTYLCDDCIFAAYDLIEQQIPGIANITISQNATLEQALGGVCNATDSPFMPSSNGSLPMSIYESAMSSTFGYNITIGNYTFSPQTATNVSIPTNISLPINSSSTMAARDVVAIKKRWMGAW